MIGNGIVTIHGKDYMTVARRLELAHEKSALESVETEVLSHDPVVIRAKVIVKGKVFTGISSVRVESARVIERDNPYEVAETSAVGRALGFAGYGLVESVATADEVARAVNRRLPIDGDGEKAQEQQKCIFCGKPAVEKKGITKTGKPYHGLFCTSEIKGHVQWLSV